MTLSGAEAFVRLENGEESLAPEVLVAGLPLLVRLVRQLGRAGASRVVLLTHRSLEAVLTPLCHYQLEREVELRVASPKSAPDGGVLLEGNAVYDLAAVQAALAEARSPEPLVRVIDRASRREAERRLFAVIRKPMAHDGPVAYLLARPLSTRISRILLGARIRPNSVTLVGLAVGLGAAACAAQGGYALVLVASVLLFLGMVIDCVDGEVARLTLATSRLGQWLDTIVDDVSVIVFTAGLGVGLQRELGEPLYLWAGVATAGAMAVSQAIIYLWLGRSGGPIDTARYPWFFVGQEGLAREGRRSVLGWLSFLGRRDSMSAAILVLAAAGARPPMLWFLAAGGGAYFLLLLLDRLLKGLRVVEEQR